MNNDKIKAIHKNNKEGIVKKNNQGYQMELITYNSPRDILVKFENNEIVRSSYYLFNKGSIKMPEKRIGKIFLSSEGYEMIVISYNSYSDVLVEFQDKWNAIVHTTWGHCKDGAVKNPYHPNIYGGIVGDKYPTYENGEIAKEFRAWFNILTRCYDKTCNEKHPTYKECIICDEWKYYWNFYEWVHKQSNYNQWKYGQFWAVDKDIIKKHNKLYSPDTCCLVSKDVNNLFLKSNSIRGKFPIGVTWRKDECMFEAQCNNPFLNKYVTIGIYNTVIDAFNAYKEYKENIIKKMAQQEYSKENITYDCYMAMINYKVEIDD